MYPEIYVGQVLDIHYLIGNKHIGRGTVVCIFSSTIQMRMETGNTLYVINPTAPNISQVYEVENGRECITVIESDEPTKPVYRYEFIYEPEEK